MSIRFPHLGLLVLAGIIAIDSSAQNADLWQVTWPTGHASPPPNWDAKVAPWMPAFRLAIAALPEDSIVDLALNQPTLLGLNAAQAATLQPLTAQRYRLMADSTLYAKAASALPYCFSAETPATGLASVYVPAGATTTTPVIVFLHGYGGSFLWYQHYLSEALPDHLIICPAYGISTTTIPQTYVAEALTATSKRVGFPLATPSLIGLSAGGFGACRLYVRAPQRYTRLICLAAYPTDDTLARFTSHSLPRFMAGEDEPFVMSGDFRRRTERVLRSCARTEQAVIPGADHFFLLTHPKPVIEQLQKWMLDASPADDKPRNPEKPRK